MCYNKFASEGGNKMKVMFSSKSNEWSTPQKLFEYLNNIYNFNLDPCATHDNAKCRKYFTIEDDGLIQDWEGHTVFCNPPYGRQIKDWVRKSYLESLKPNTKVVMLIPARTDTRYWHEYIFKYANKILFIEGRLKFGDGKGSAPFPSAIVEFGGHDQEMKTLKKNEFNT